MTCKICGKRLHHMQSWKGLFHPNRDFYCENKDCSMFLKFVNRKGITGDSE